MYLSVFNSALINRMPKKKGKRKSKVSSESETVTEVTTASKKDFILSKCYSTLKLSGLGSEVSISYDATGNLTLVCLLSVVRKVKMQNVYLYRVQWIVQTIA